MPSSRSSWIFCRSDPLEAPDAASMASAKSSVAVARFARIHCSVGTFDASGLSTSISMRAPVVMFRRGFQLVVTAVSYRPPS